MKTRLRITILLTRLVLPRRVAAHPMGNFSINHYSRIQVSSGAISIPTILDFAESGTFAMVPDPRRASEHAGEWARVQLELESPWTPTNVELNFRDDNYPGRIGWKEVVIEADPSLIFPEANPYASDRSRELTAYPEDLLSSAPAMVSASV